jgi:DNA-binding transcriptional ArsR family regulator
MNPLNLTDEALEMVAQRFRCMGEAMRLKILRSLESGEKSVGELTGGLNTTQANVSKHLKMLVEARLLARRAQGTSAYYSIADPMVLTLCQTVCEGLEEKVRSQAHGLGLVVTRKRK